MVTHLKTRQDPQHLPHLRVSNPFAQDKSLSSGWISRFFSARIKI